jgi:hypothetical protein
MEQLKKILVILLLLTAQTFSESKAGGVIAKFMPTVTETATLANVVNVFLKVADWVSATSKVVGNVKSSVNDIRNAKNAIEDIVQTAKSMKDFNLYDMDSWAATVDKMQYIAGPKTSEFLTSLAFFEVHAIDGIADYIEANRDIQNFNIRDEANKHRRLIRENFAPDEEPESFFDEIMTTADMVKILESDNNNFSNMIISMENRLENDFISPEKKRELQDSVSIMKRKIGRNNRKIAIKKHSLSGDKKNPADSIFSDAQEMMAYNLVEAKTIYSMVQHFANYTAELHTAMERIKKNQLPSGQNSYLEYIEEDYSEALKTGVRDETNNRNIYGDKENNADFPNQAPTPKKSEKSADDYSFGDYDKKEVTTQDVLSLRNAINYTLLRQERLLADIEGMKGNTFAYLLIIDGYNRSSELAQIDALKFHATKAQQIYEIDPNGFVSIKEEWKGK